MLILLLTMAGLILAGVGAWLNSARLVGLSAVCLALVLLIPRV